MLRLISPIRNGAVQLMFKSDKTYLIQRKIQQLNSIRLASQLYPITSQQWDDAMLQAEATIGTLRNLSNLHEWVSAEFDNITQYLQKLVGTNHPMLETAKRCSYISEGRMGGAQARGLTVILTAKAVESLAKHTAHDPQDSSNSLLKNQLSLAEMTEMTYSAYMIHRGVMDLKLNGLNEVTASADITESDQYTRGIHYANQVSILCGDFLFAYVMRSLAKMLSCKAVALVASAVSDFMEGEFLLLEDWTSKDYLNSLESRDFTRWYQRSQSAIGSLQGNTCQAALVLAGVEDKLQRHAYEFGKHLGLAWQAHTELQPFLNETYQPIELPEMPAYPSFDLNCLPVILFLREEHDTNKNFRIKLNEVKTQRERQEDLMHQHRHQEPVDYKKLHDMVLKQGYAIQETYKIITQYSQTARSHLESFPPSEAKDTLVNICESLNKK